MKHFLSLKDVTPEEMTEIFRLSADVKKNPERYSARFGVRPLE